MRHTSHNVPVSALIVDDEELARNLVKAFIQRDPDLMLIGECADGAAALEIINEQRPDLVFLDVQMSVMSGMKLAERLVDCEHVPYVIFITAFDEFAIQAFELNALDYLVKPIEKSRFRTSVERAKTAIRNREMLALTRRLVDLGRKPGSSPADRTNPAQEITVRNGDDVHQLTTDDIIWIEAANQYVHIHTRVRSYTVSESLGQYAKRIQDSRFFRIHRSALANAAAVTRVSRRRNGTHSLELDNGETLVVARSRASLVPDILRAARLAQIRA